MTTIDTDPPGASVYIEGGFVGISPASFHLPAMPEVVIRLERQGSSPVEETLRRNPGYPKDAPEGVGWDERYFWQLNSR